MKFTNNIDLSKNQLINVILHNSTSHPTSPLEGQIYFNITDNVIYYYDGTQWLVLGRINAGNGLSSSYSGGVEQFDINVDNSTLEISTDTVRIKDLGVTTAKLADSAVTTVKINNKAVTFSKIQDLTAMTVIGSIAGGTPIEISILNENNLGSNSQTAIPTQASVKAYVDSTIANIGSLQGSFDATTNTNLPGSGTTKKGDYWYVTVAGTVQGQVFNVGDVIIANQANPTVTNANHYVFLESNRSQATTTILGLVTLATNAEVQTGTDTSKVVTPSGLSSRTATETRTGIAEIATQAETNAGTDDSRIVTPLKLKAFYDSVSGTFTATIGNGTNTSFTISHGLSTKNVMVEVYDNTAGDSIHTDISRPTTSSITVSFGTTNVPTTNQYTVLIRKV